MPRFVADIYHQGEPQVHVRLKFYMFVEIPRRIVKVGQGRTGSDRVGKRMEVEPLKNEEGIKTMVFVMMLLDSSCAVVLD
jgi:hypothetical protein